MWAALSAARLVAWSAAPRASTAMLSAKRLILFRGPGFPQCSQGSCLHIASDAFRWLCWPSKGASSCQPCHTSACSCNIKGRTKSRNGQVSAISLGLRPADALSRGLLGEHSGVSQCLREDQCLYSQYGAQQVAGCNQWAAGHTSSYHIISYHQVFAQAGTVVSDSRGGYN